MKILIIRNYPSYMKVKNNTYNIQEVGLAKALVRRGTVCDIIFWTDMKEKTVSIPVNECGEVHIFYRKGRTLLKNTVYLNCEDLFAQYDILQPCEYNQMQSWILAKKYPEKTVIYHGPYYSPFNKRYNLMCKVFDVVFLRRYIKQNTKFLVKSWMAKEFLSEKGIADNNVEVVGVGIDTEMLSYGNSKCTDCKEPFYQTMKKDTCNPKLLYIGRLEERRNILFIFDVLAKVLKKEPDAKLYMIGNGEREYVKKAFAHADELGIRKSIVWKKEIQQKYLSEIYQLADFFLLPTEYDIFGMVLLEAMYYKVVVLSTRNGGSSMLITDGENGFIVEELESDIWSGLIVELNKDPVKKDTIGRRASKKISEEYTWDALAKFFEGQFVKRLEIAD